MLSHLALEFVRSSDHAFDKSNIVALEQEPIWSKMDLSGDKKNTLRAKIHKFFGSREVHFWTRIWSGRGYGLRAGTEK